MRKFLALSLILISYILGAIVFSPRAYSDELDDLNSKINDLQKQLSESQKATKPLESQLTSIQSQMRDIENRVTTIETDLAVKKKSIDAGYKELEAQQELLNQSIRNLYMRNYAFSPILIFVSNDNASSITKTLVYQKKGADKDKALITNTALRIADLEQKQKELEEEQKKLAAVKQKLDSQRAEVAKVVQGAKDYQATLSKQIAELSAKQQALLAQKLSSLNIPTSAYTTQGGCVDDRNVDPGFSPRFAFFTFGVPNRVGLNQYGAKGRAEAGQSAESILSTYYSADLNKSYDTGINIHVVGTNEYGQSFDTNWNIEDYVKHIYEMPTNWNMEALKAQAVAARSYALATTNNGANTICPSQSCQVVKQEENSDSWKQAVDATRGWVLTSGGSPIRAWFSSTHGGYEFTSSDIGWNGTPWTKRLVDTKSGSASSFDDLFNNAYDKASPWFYCDWGSRASYNKTAWLKSDEVADIANVLMLAKADSSTQKHLSQTDKPNPDGVDTWDAGRVRQELSSRGVTPFNSISNVSVDWDRGSGRTTSITFNGDGGSKSFDGGEFKTYFNLRAPSNINIVGPLYNVERK